MNILVTGGAGYVGGFAARHLQAAGYRVVVLDNLSEGHRPAAPDGTLVVGEIADGDAVRVLLREHEIEAVVHFAASCYVGDSHSSVSIFIKSPFLLPASSVSSFYFGLAPISLAVYFHDVISHREHCSAAEKVTFFGFDESIHYGLKRRVLDR